MPFSSLYLRKWRFLLTSVKSCYSVRLHHYSAASRGFLLGELSQGNLEAFKLCGGEWRAIVTADTFRYAMCLKDTLHGSYEVGCICLFNKITSGQWE